MIGFDPIRALKSPTLVIQRRARSSPGYDGAGSRDEPTEGPLAPIPGAGHLPFLETPNHFFTLVETFLAGL